MSSQIIGLTDWLKTPPGEYLLAWERERIAEADADIAAGRVIPDEDLDGWLADLVSGKPVRIP